VLKCIILATNFQKWPSAGKGVGRKFSGGGGGKRKKDQKLEKKGRKIALFSLYLLY